MLKRLDEFLPPPGIGVRMEETRWSISLAEPYNARFLSRNGAKQRG
jgi:hypothetical protein